MTNIQSLSQSLVTIIVKIEIKNHLQNFKHPGIAKSFDDIIGNYSQYIRHYKRCGLNSKSLNTDYECFEYHKTFNSDIKDGRVGRLGELPWMVSVIGAKKLDVWVTDIIL